jgi:tetratricopeptide (TPR) repeat protein
MSRIAILFALCLLVAAPARAADCPPVPDRAAEFDALVVDLQAAKGEAQARDISARMWEIWTDAPDSLAQSLLDRGMGLRGAGDFAGSAAVLGDLVEYCPAYAEGWNQRAFARFLSRDFEAALADLDAALALSPRHLGALSGRALTLLGLGRTDEARAALNAALAINPWLAERRLADPGGPLAIPGTDL